MQVDTDKLYQNLVNNKEIEIVRNRMECFVQNTPDSLYGKNQKIVDVCMSGGAILSNILDFEHNDIDVFIRHSNFINDHLTKKKIVDDIATTFFGQGNSYIPDENRDENYLHSFSLRNGRLPGINKEVQLIIGRDTLEFDIPACEIFYNYKRKISGNGLSDFSISKSNPKRSIATERRIIKYIKRGVPLKRDVPKKLMDEVLSNPFSSAQFSDIEFLALCFLELNSDNVYKRQDIKSLGRLIPKISKEAMLVRHLGPKKIASIRMLTPQIEKMIVWED